MGRLAPFETSVVRNRSSPISLISKWTIAFVASTLLLWSTGLHRYLWLIRTVAPIPPSGPIQWTPCGDRVECGRLDVPLDYHDASAGTASLSVARILSRNPKTRLGSLFVNPGGGPGGSGVSFLYRTGFKLSDLLDSRYDIVSWDPRGINETTPRIECFPDQPSQDFFLAHTYQETIFETRNLTDPIDLEIFKYQLRVADAQNEAVYALCENTTGMDGLSHVGTVTVVRDLEFLSRTIEGENAPVNFWGFSYGTIVGSYFVNMFPNRVGRVAIDGVVDPVLWSHTPVHEWPQYDLVNTEAALEDFVTSCAEAGPSRCSLATDTSSAQSILKDIDRLISDLYERPLPVPFAERPGILTSGMVKGFIFIELYGPRFWSNLASALKSAIEGNGAPIMDAMQRDFFDDLSDLSAVPETYMAITAVTCVDAPAVHFKNAEDVINDMVEASIKADEVSRHFGAITQAETMCHRWKARETESFTGPFNETLSNDILVIGNTRDPITPLVNARFVNSLLPNSRLIIQRGSGHTSLAETSLCTGKALRAYFLDNTLPENGLECDISERLFPEDEGSTLWTEEVESAEDKRLLEILREIGIAADGDLKKFKTSRRQ